MALQNVEKERFFAQKEHFFYSKTNSFLQNELS